jgi:hypothetical protein
MHGCALYTGAQLTRHTTSKAAAKKHGAGGVEGAIAKRDAAAAKRAEKKAEEQVRLQCAQM